MFLTLFLIIPLIINDLSAQEHSVAREWNEVLLHAVRNDFARPTVHARNLMHVSMALYDCWAVYEEDAKTYFLGKNHGNYTCFLGPVNTPADKKAAQEEAMSYAAYKLIRRRFQLSPGVANIYQDVNRLFSELGYDPNYTSSNYISGPPAALGNYIADCILEFGLQDGSNEQGSYNNTSYQPINSPLAVNSPGNPNFPFPNRWQPLALNVFIDQSGNVIPFNTPPFLSPEWGQVYPFALEEEDLTVYNRNGFDYFVYHDPGDPPYIDITDNNEMSQLYKWGFELVSVWGSHNDPNDGVMIDISPASIGNISDYPDRFEDFDEFYDFFEGGDPSEGHTMNPVTGAPYEPQMVPRGDYTRVLAEFWADGPDSETPPGHWFTLLNYVNDHPMFEKRYRGKGEIIDNLEWDVKSYLMMGGAMHDCAIAAWGIKGWYDYLRPISGIRSLCQRGQCTDSSMPNYNVGGIDLIPGYIELIETGDPLAGQFGENIGKVKLYTWKGPDYISDPETTIAGVDWILGENWWPYQRPSFVTPPFAGYVSGHSTYSRAAADLLTTITGSEFFPGGIGEFVAEKDEFLVFEDGPSQDIVLQWATYKDASEQTSLSRIWGGIHPPADDIPGRLIGAKIAVDVVDKAEKIFFNDNDGDGYLSYEDCNDEDVNINPGVAETCDGGDNNCNNEIDEGLPIFTYYLDFDNDGYGDINFPMDTCQSTPIMGFVDNDIDCDDSNNGINVDAIEVCDGIDNDCNGSIDDGLQIYTYFIDNDGDGFGDMAVAADTCQSTPISGYVDNDMDCDDTNADINPSLTEIEYNGLDDDCNPLTLDDDLDMDGFDLANDCDDANANVNPATIEIEYNGLDDDCDPMTFDDDLDLDGFVLADDCDDGNEMIYPGAEEISDNDIDEDCNGIDLYKETKLFPNPVQNELTIRYDIEGELSVSVVGMDGKLVRAFTQEFINNEIKVDFSGLHPGIYILRISYPDNKNEFLAEKIYKM